MADSLPPREWQEDLQKPNPSPSPDNAQYLSTLHSAHLGNHSHPLAVSAISQRIARFHSLRKPFRIYHGSTNSTRRHKFTASHMVDTSPLSHILSVDRAAKTALVEPNVPMDALVAFLQPYGLVPPVVMEFPGITVGGGFAGTSGESSSFRHGFFDKTVAAIEIVLGNGDVVAASETENADLFHGAAGSFGTLGVVTLLELRLVESASLVELMYYPVASAVEALRVLEEKSTDEGIDYLDGILYSKTEGVIVTGRRSNEPSPHGAKVVQFTRASDPWFYLHAQQQAAPPPSTPPRSPQPPPQPRTDATPLRDYLFRYDRGAFWTGRYAFAYFLVPFTRLTRALLDHFMHTRVMYHALHESGLGDTYIIQDLAIPLSRAAAFLAYVDAQLATYPLWLCPLKPIADAADAGSFHPVGRAGELLVNVGVWGPGPRDRAEFVAVNRALEREVRGCGGMKWLYAHAYYDEAEFWDIYDRGKYEALRAKYHAQALPSVYDKVHTDTEDRRSLRRRVMMAVWPLSGLYGVFKALLGGNYMLDGQGRGFGGLLMVLAALMGVLGIVLALFSVERTVPVG